MPEVAATLEPGPSGTVSEREGVQQTATTPPALPLPNLEDPGVRDILAYFRSQAEQTNQLLAEIADLRARVNNPTPPTTTTLPAEKKESDADKFVPFRKIVRHWPISLADYAPTIDPEGPAVPHLLDHQLVMLHEVCKKLITDGHIARSSEFISHTSTYAWSRASLNLLTEAILQLIPREIYNDKLLKIINTLGASIELAAIRATLIQCATLTDKYDKNFVAFIEAKLTDPGNAYRMVSPEMAQAFAKYQSEFQNKLLTVITKEGVKLHKVTDGQLSSQHTAGSKSGKGKGKKKIADASTAGSA
jgi:hypothetical protein